jgi:hypothetical protein
MFRILAFVAFAAAVTTVPASDPKTILRVERSSPGDLEVGGDLVGVAPGSTRYVRYEDLLHCPRRRTA